MPARRLQKASARVADGRREGVREEQGPSSLTAHATAFNATASISDMMIQKGGGVRTALTQGG